MFMLGFSSTYTFLGNNVKFWKICSLVKVYWYYVLPAFFLLIEFVGWHCNLFGFHMVDLSNDKFRFRMVICQM